MAGESTTTMSNGLLYNKMYAITEDAIDTSNGHSIDLSGYKDDKVVIIVRATLVTGDSVLTIEAGDKSAASQGDLDIAFGDGVPSTQQVVLESARFKDADEKVTISWVGAGALAGSIMAINRP